MSKPTHRRLVLSLLAAMLLSGCASWHPPAPPEGHYFCKPASAVRYRGEAREGAVSIRPAPKHGSCRNAR